MDNLWLKNLYDKTEDVLAANGDIELSLEAEEFSDLRADHRFEYFKNLAEDNPDNQILEFFLISDPDDKDFDNYNKFLDTFLSK